MRINTKSLLNIVSLMMENDPRKNFPTKGRVVITAGSPGSGKSTIEKLVLGGLPFSRTDVDDLLTMLMKREKMSTDMTGNSEEERSKIDSMRNKTFSWIEKRQAIQMSKRENFIVSTTGANYEWTAELILGLKNKGYSVKMLFVDCSVDVAIERNRKRERKIPEDILVSKWKSVDSNKEKFRSLLGTDFHIIDNSGKTSISVNDSSINSLSKIFLHWK